MTPPFQLFPDVRVTADRNVFKVLSDTTAGKWYRVDAESREGLMACNCPNYEIAHNYNCKHIIRVRALIACIAMQGVIKTVQQSTTTMQNENS